MRRRDLVSLLGGTAALWPLRALAQSPVGSHRVGLLNPLGLDAGPFEAALIRGLAQHGYVPGKNLTLERRGAGGHPDRLPALVAELAAAKVEVIIALGYQPVLAAKEGTVLPVIAFSAGDPVAGGLADSLARPGGHLTGISDVSAEVTPKRLQLLKEFAPGLRRVAMLWNADDLAMTLRYKASETGAKALGLSVQPLGVREPDDFDEAFAAMTSDKPDAILMVSDPLTNLNRKRVSSSRRRTVCPASTSTTSSPATAA
jgi:putative ABC transport system substrate-binding protein